LTADIDIVLVLRPPDIPALQSAFPEAEYYVPPAETMREAGARSAGGMFNLIHHWRQFKA